MKRSLSLLLVILLLLPGLHVKAQNYDDAGVYMKAINNVMSDFNKTYMAYISAAAHSNRWFKIEKLRQQVVDNLTTCRYKLIDLPYYKHDNSLRQSNIDYLWLLNKVFNDDYKHLVNMEGLIEQSFDQMELYLRLQEKINDTLKVATDRIAGAEKDFAAKYNITLVDSRSGVVEKMEIANKVSKYHDRVYLLFFKCAWQELQVMDAINKKNITKIEQARSALQKYTEDGLVALDSLTSYDNDAALATACRRAVTVYQKEADTELPKISDFLLKAENFNKLKATYDAKPKNSRTKEDTDAYDKALADINTSVTATQQTFKTMLTNRDKAIISWSAAEQKFIDAHMPYYH